MRDEIASASVDLVDFDPPFNSRADYNVLFKVPSGQQARIEVSRTGGSEMMQRNSPSRCLRLKCHRSTNAAASGRQRRRPARRGSWRHSAVRTGHRGRRRPFLHCLPAPPPIPMLPGAALPPEARAVNIAEALLQGLKAYGAGEIFGIPGDFALPFFKVVEESRILPLHTLSHEPAVGFAADAAARFRGTHRRGGGDLRGRRLQPGQRGRRRLCREVAGGGDLRRARAGARAGPGCCCTIRAARSTPSSGSTRRSPAPRRGWTTRPRPRPRSPAC